MRVLRFLTLMLLAALGFAPHAQAARGGDRDYGNVQIKTIAKGLDSPRHLALGARGDVFVAEAGRGGTGPCFTGAEGLACMGATGAVTKIDHRGRQYRIAKGLASMANKPTDYTPGYDNAIGPHGIFLYGDDRVLITNGGPTEPKVGGVTVSRETLADQNPVASLFGKVLKIDRRGRAIPVGDIWDYERDFNPDKLLGNPAIDSNPVDVLMDDGKRLVVADAGGNALDTVDVFGRVKNLTVFPNQGAQAVPTSVVEGPDHQYYVSQLTGYPFRPGAANIFRVDPRTGARTIVASGFTHLMDLAFGPNGTLYALEIDHNGLLVAGDEGAIFAVSPTSGSKRRIALPANKLPFPGGIAVGRDGQLYVTINAGSPGGGKVIRIRTH